MARAPRVDIEVKGLKELMRLLKNEEALYGGPWRRAQESLGDMAASRGVSRAPTLSGKLAGTIKPRVQNKPIPRWVAVRVSAKRGRYAYPRLIEYSKKHGHAGWLRGAVESVMGSAESVLSKAAQEIERNFASKA